MFAAAAIDHYVYMGERQGDIIGVSMLSAASLIGGISDFLLVRKRRRAGRVRHPD